MYPTRTVYAFKDAGIELTVTFLSPLLIDDLDVLSRPVTYVTLDVRSADGRPHDVRLYFDASSEIAVNTADQKVIWSRLRAGDLQVLSIGSKDQPVLEKAGDNLRIDWGYFYLAVAPQEKPALALASDGENRTSFIQNGGLPARDDFRMPRPVSEGYPLAAAAFDLGTGRRDARYRAG